ncbi:hypothetical protein C8J57DRAFT_56346 [Mycena rebaudengoi]|nr:hypothetical protein C8J57DRAFT_56346 [Mycena rebaudengoi]
MLPTARMGAFLRRTRMVDGNSVTWDNFLLMMEEQGFQVDHTVADLPGSATKFLPPDMNDVAITFHKPYPDPTLHPILAREFAKKLNRQYHWELDTTPEAIVVQQA